MLSLSMSAFRGKADIPSSLANGPLMKKSLMTKADIAIATATVAFLATVSPSANSLPLGIVVVANDSKSH